MKFILEDTNAQIDKILYDYCEVFSRKKSHVAVVNFILTLSNLDITKMYKFQKVNSQKFEDWEEEIISDLVGLGMIRIVEYVDSFLINGIHL